MINTRAAASSLLRRSGGLAPSNGRCQHAAFPARRRQQADLRDDVLNEGFLMMKRWRLFLGKSSGGKPEYTMNGTSGS
jgi:hypothetical protein